MAEDFLFQDDYTVLVGDVEINLAQLLDMLGYNIRGLRKRIKEIEYKTNLGRAIPTNTQLDLF